VIIFVIVFTTMANRRLSEELDEGTDGQYVRRWHWDGVDTVGHVERRKRVWVIRIR